MLDNFFSKGLISHKLTVNKQNDITTNKQDAIKSIIILLLNKVIKIKLFYQNELMKSAFHTSNDSGLIRIENI